MSLNTGPSARTVQYHRTIFDLYRTSNSPGFSYHCNTSNKSMVFFPRLTVILHPTPRERVYRLGPLAPPRQWLSCGLSQCSAGDGALTSMLSPPVWFIAFCWSTFRSAVWLPSSELRLLHYRSQSSSLVSVPSFWLPVFLSSYLVFSCCSKASDPSA